MSVNCNCCGSVAKKSRCWKINLSVFLLVNFFLKACAIWILCDDTLRSAFTLISNFNLDWLFIALGVISICLFPILPVAMLCFKSKVLRGIYIAITTTYLIGILVGSIVFKYKFLDNMENMLKTSLPNAIGNQHDTYYYYDSSSQCFTTTAGSNWDYVQFTYKCCGVFNYSTPYSNFNFQSQCPGLLFKYLPWSCFPQENNSTVAWGGLPREVVYDSDGVATSGRIFQYKAQTYFNESAPPYAMGCQDSIVEHVWSYIPVLIIMCCFISASLLFSLAFTVYNGIKSD